jgi:hypothetical protein
MRAFGHDAIGRRLDHPYQFRLVEIALPAPHPVFDGFTRQCASDKHGLAGAYHTPTVVIQSIDLTGQDFAGRFPA